MDDEILNWIYKIGLKLDGVVPLIGMTNQERIEFAINDYIKIKQQPHNKQINSDRPTICPHCKQDSIQETIRVGKLNPPRNSL